MPEPLVLAPGEGMYAKAADRRCRERFSASEPISGRKARATIIRRASVASDVCLSSRSRDVPEPDPQSPSSWRCSHPVKECGVPQGLLFQEPNQGLRPRTPSRRLLCYAQYSLLLWPHGGVKAGFSFPLLLSFQYIKIAK